MEPKESKICQKHPKTLRHLQSKKRGESVPLEQLHRHSPSTLVVQEQTFSYHENCVEFLESNWIKSTNLPTKHYIWNDLIILETPSQVKKKKQLAEAFTPRDSSNHWHPQGALPWLLLHLISASFNAWDSSAFHSISAWSSLITNTCPMASASAFLKANFLTSLWCENLIPLPWIDAIYNIYI